MLFTATRGQEGPEACSSVNIMGPSMWGHPAQTHIDSQTHTRRPILWHELTGQPVGNMLAGARAAGGQCIDHFAQGCQRRVDQLALLKGGALSIGAGCSLRACQIHLRADAGAMPGRPLTACCVCKAPTWCRTFLLHCR